MVRCILAVVAGFGLWSVLWLGANAGVAGALPDHFDENGVTAKGGILLLILVLSVGISVVSGLLTGKIALEKGRRCGLILGVILLVVGIAVQAQYWTSMPIWYHLSFLALLLPAAVMGARMKAGAPVGA